MKQEVMFPGLSMSDGVDYAIARIRAYQPTDRPYWGCFSGGKDSVVIKALALLAGVDVEWHYSVTTIDPPELVRFIKEEHGNVRMDRPKRNFFAMIPEKGMPTRRIRWCCEQFKESRNPKETTLLMGVRAAESPRRAKTWGICTIHKRTKSPVINPIIDWPDEMVWEFIREFDIPYCSLYDEGFTRLGCIGCPMAGVKRYAEFRRWPRYEMLWKKAAKKAWEARVNRPGHIEKYPSWEMYWEWWMSDKGLPKHDECQGVLDMFS